MVYKCKITSHDVTDVFITEWRSDAITRYVVIFINVVCGMSVVEYFVAYRLIIFVDYRGVFIVEVVRDSIYDLFIMYDTF